MTPVDSRAELVEAFSGSAAARPVVRDGSGCGHAAAVRSPSPDGMGSYPILPDAGKALLDAR